MWFSQSPRIVELSFRGTRLLDCFLIFVSKISSFWEEKWNIRRVSHQTLLHFLCLSTHILAPHPFTNRPTLCAECCNINFVTIDRTRDECKKFSEIGFQAGWTGKNGRPSGFAPMMRASNEGVKNVYWEQVKSKKHIQYFLKQITSRLLWRCVGNIFY